jgi:hypothetical protein
LEQTITELSGRAEELEKEAAELRKENGWLKEMVIMKSRVHIAGLKEDTDTQEGARGGDKSKQT